MNRKTYLAKVDNEDDEDTAVIKSRLVFRKGSHIYFYDEIDPETTAIFMQLYEDARNYLTQHYAPAIVEGGELPEVVTVHINSPGGYVTCSLALYDFLEMAPIPCIGIVEGIAASGASILLCGCVHRAITKHSTVLIHELRGGSYGKFSELQDQASNHEYCMKQIKSIYAEKTNIAEKDLDEVLRHDAYWSAEDSLKYGIVDQIIGADEDSEEDKKKSKKSTKTTVSRKRKVQVVKDTDVEKPKPTRRRATTKTKQ